MDNDESKRDETPQSVPQRPFTRAQYRKLEEAIALETRYCHVLLTRSNSELATLVRATPRSASTLATNARLARQTAESFRTVAALLDDAADFIDGMVKTREDWREIFAEVDKRLGE
jgi:hypothetical protein